MNAPPNEISPSEAEADSKVIAATSTSVPQSGPLRPAPAATEADATAAPCHRCGHALSAPKSVARELGPVCVVVVGRGESDD